MSLALQGGFLTTGLPGNLSCKKDLTAAVSLGFDSYWINLESKEDKIKILRHTSFCITSSRFIYLSSTDSNLFLFTAEEHSIVGFPGDSVVKNLPATAGDTGVVVSIPGSARSPGGGNGNPLQCSYLENPMDREAWQATVQGVTKSQTQLSDRVCNIPLYICATTSVSNYLSIDI